MVMCLSYIQGRLTREFQRDDLLVLLRVLGLYLAPS